MIFTAKEKGENGYLVVTGNLYHMKLSKLSLILTPQI